MVKVVVFWGCVVALGWLAWVVWKRAVWKSSLFWLVLAAVLFVAWVTWFPAAAVAALHLL
jgi:hypothetical protein